MSPTARMAAAGLSAVLLLATLGEGGGAPGSLLVWHAAVVVLVLAALLAAGRRDRGVASPPLAAFALFLVIVGAGAVRAPYAYASILLLLELGCWTALAALSAAAGAGLLSRIVAPLRLGAAAQGALVLYQWVAGQPRPAGTFLNPNHLGLWLAAVLLLGAGAGAVGAARLPRIGSVALAIPALAALLVCGSRGALLGFGAGAAWLLALRWRRLGAGWRGAVAVGLVLVAALASLRVLQRQTDFDPFRYQRLAIWKASAAAWLDDPWWGTGPGQFGEAARNLRFPDGDGPFRYDRRFAVSHSDAIRLPAELGGPAALALLAALVLGVREIRVRRRRGERTQAGDGAVAALVAIGVQAVVDNPSRWPAVYLLAAVLMGSLLSVPRTASPRPAFGWRAGLAAALVLAFAVADVAPYLAWRQVSDLPRGGLDEDGLARLQRAVTLNPIHPDYRLRLARHASADGASWDLDAYATAREAAEAAVRLQPAGADYRRGLARVEALACRTLLRDRATRDRAREHYEQAERLSRYDPFLPVELAAFLVDTGDPAGARRAAERALALEPEAALPRLLLADALLSAHAPGGAARAAALVDEAVSLAARWGAAVEGTYGRELSRVEPRVLDRLAREIASARDR